jgi:hypothetical protein
MQSVDKLDFHNHFVDFVHCVAVILVSASIETGTPLLDDGVCDHLKGQCPGVCTEMVERISFDTILVVRTWGDLRSKFYQGHMNE